MAVAIMRSNQGRFGQDSRAHGYRYEHEDIENAHFSTIMGYTDETLSYRPNDQNYDDFDLIPAWSNSNQTYAGPETNYQIVNIGDEQHNNALIINQNASVVANHYTTSENLAVNNDEVSNGEYVNINSKKRVSTGFLEVKNGGEADINPAKRAKLNDGTSFKSGSKVKVRIDINGDVIMQEARQESGSTVIVQEPEIVELAEPQADLPSLIVYPNPFQHTTSIQYNVLEKDIPVHLLIYNLRGDIVAEPVKEPTHAPGQHTVTWQAKDLPSGVYVCKLQAGDYITYEKVVLMQ